MSAINLTTLAQNLNITTVEQLHVYTGFLLNRLTPSLKFNEVANEAAIPVALFNIFTMPDGTQRIITRTSIAIKPEFLSDRSKKLWMFADELDTSTIPVGFLSN